MIASAVLAAATLAAQSLADERVPVVAKTHFFAVDPSSGQAGIVETHRIPHRPGASCYQWAITVPPETRSVTVRELFELPAAAEQWNSDPNGVTAVAADRSRAVTQIEESLEDGLITHGWCVAEGDPAGAHRISVFVGDRLLHQFDFEIVHDTY